MTILLRKKLALVLSTIHVIFECLFLQIIYDKICIIQTRVTVQCTASSRTKAGRWYFFLSKLFLCEGASQENNLLHIC